ncbi:uncharacterized protein MELLADRAFT_72899 [Melampsora larici-populina 98AG31]|uniref:Uncharacterized protein n=1 Tax=Melampsora larici-populina (strain 98AG31 / pathotype 3-4-7) TaxID=747676 RepID=F4S0G4_MELLP|nr:uncharacterized protein MELLADRAFT_72899 [Melampsora larici-populina 98AG31]EGG01761.1 hypothetical protein MELLADRAFT_72899 [Melampsora larici-populina 98AG31]
MSSVSSLSRINPFKFELELIEGMVNPRFPSWALAILILFATMRGMLILVCIAIMVIPLGKGHASRKKHWFLFRRIYKQPGRGIPYVIPNRSMIIVVCELCSSCLYLVAACENYKTYRRSGIKEGSSGWFLTLWYGLTWIPSYLGIMMAAFSLCYACLCDVNGNRKSKIPQLLTPIVYNSAWTLWTIITISSMAFWTFRTTRALSELEAACIHTFKLLQRGADAWDADPSQMPPRGISNSQLYIIRAAQKSASVIDGWAITWVVLAVSLAVFYLFTVQLLIRLLKQVLRKRAIDSMAVDVKWSSPIWQELEQEFRFLFKSSILVTLSIISQISELAYQTHSSKNLTDVNWRIGSALITQLPGIFMTPAILVQSWRIFTERSEEFNFRKVPLTFDDKKIPEMTSQLLGWDTTVCWGKEIDLDAVNFPGLYEIQSTFSKETEDVDQKDKRVNLKTPAGDISVMRSITVTHEEI